MFSTYGYNSPELWNKENLLYTQNINQVHKTIYDPSVCSFSLPKTAALTGFSVDNLISANSAGFTFYSEYIHLGVPFYIPTFGYRISSGLMDSKFSGNIFTAGPKNIQYGYYMGYNINGIALVTEGAPRNWGITIWPVKQ